MAFLSQHTGGSGFASRATIQANIGNQGYRFSKVISDPFSGLNLSVTFAMTDSVSEEALSVDGRFLYTTRTLPASGLMSDVALFPYRDTYVVNADTLEVTHYINGSSLGEVFTMLNAAPTVLYKDSVYVIDRSTGKQYVNKDTDPLTDSVWVENLSASLEQELADFKALVASAQTVQDNDISSLGTKVTPVGCVIAMASSANIQGFIRCNGSQLSVTTYADLFAVIGETYALAGDGTAATTSLFRVPDFRGTFLRGLDAGRGLDSGRTLGSLQGDAIRNITGIAGLNSPASYVMDPARSSGALKGIISQTVNSYAYTVGIYNGGNVELNASWQVPTAVENRPINQAVEYWIKY